MTDNIVERHKLRHEKKFALTYGIYEIFRRRCAATMKKDHHSKGEDYRITSLYFDDIYHSSYNDKLNGIMNRRKYRIRTYNLNPERITLEGKFKEKEYIYKTGARLTVDEYEAILKGDYAFCGNREDLQDFYAYVKTGNPKPATIVDYLREAYTAEAGNVRITFDKGISAGFGSVDMFKASYSPAFESNVVLEIKFDRFIPSYIQELFTGFALREESISKYVLCINKFSEVSKRWIL